MKRETPYNSTIKNARAPYSISTYDYRTCLRQHGSSLPQRENVELIAIKDGRQPWTRFCPLFLVLFTVALNYEVEREGVTLQALSLADEKLNNCRSNTASTTLNGSVRDVEMMVQLQHSTNAVQQWIPKFVMLKLPSKTRVKLDNEAVKKEVRVLIERSEELEQYMRLNNVLIVGIPKLEKENVTDIDLKIGQKIGVNITASDIDIAHRLPQLRAGKPPTIIVKFVRRTIKVDFMREKAKLRNTNSVSLVDAPAHNIYLNEHLTFVWVKKGHICIREEEGKPAVLYNEGKKWEVNINENANGLNYSFLLSQTKVGNSSQDCTGQVLAPP
uniref:Uncharacterized protein n=1 Tax=Timema genevievae TaxID=629358 RepID=A0A7R9PJZ2_TIMGE|nr:unnamed protein product [Timema genevievae]